MFKDTPARQTDRLLGVLKNIRGERRVYFVLLLGLQQLLLENVNNPPKNLKIYIIQHVL